MTPMRVKTIEGGLHQSYHSRPAIEGVVYGNRWLPAPPQDARPEQWLHYVTVFDVVKHGHDGLGRPAVEAYCALYDVELKPIED